MRLHPDMQKSNFTRTQKKEAVYFVINERTATVLNETEKKIHSKGYRFYRILWLTLVCFTPTTHSKLGCKVHVKDDISDPQVLILKPGNGNDMDSFYLPDNDGIIRFTENSIVELACPGNSLLLNKTRSPQSVISVKCSNDAFTVNRSIYPFSAFKCTKSAEGTIRFTGNYCGSGRREIEIGYQLPNRFIRHILICFDDVLKTTFYTVHKLSKRINASQKNVSRVHWMKGEGFDDLNIIELYKSATTQSVLNSLVGLSKSSEKYISRAHQKYLAKGHLAPKADFIYGAQQTLTFYYANAVPQWQVFNNGNWLAIERSVRDYASSKQFDLEVYTGTYQVQSLPHEFTHERIYLYLSNGKVPVPRLLWKVLYNRANQTGIALIGGNDPYFAETTTICRDISHQCTWVSWNRCNVSSGCGYCCEVNDFRKTVRSLPKFKVTKVL